MLSRSPSMPASSPPAPWDIFCNVIDNYGDIGVCWRLARQLNAEHGLQIRLWVDELAAFQKICPKIDPRLPTQTVDGIEVRHWSADSSEIFPGETRPGEVVIEAFACHLPETFILAMAERKPAPVWINLDYLSAEDWVSGCHALPSPHPRLPLTKYFFLPGFSDTTGGLLREYQLEERRQAFCASAEIQNDFWRSIEQTPPEDDALRVSLFAYENQAIHSALEFWAEGDQPVCCFAPMTRSLSAIEAFVGHSLEVNELIQRGMLGIRVLPFVTQADYDKLLWACDINFVRGEDSFVRSQWAAKPMVWQIYPQDDDVHLIKLQAFLDLYCTGLTNSTSVVVRNLFKAWNTGQGISSAIWTEWQAVLPDLRQHATNWATTQAKQEDLCSNLVRFCRNKL